MVTEFSIPEAAIERARDIYSLRLAPGAKLQDLLDADTFGQQTHPTEVVVPEVLSGRELRDHEDYDHWGNALHFFAHRPQRTEFLFFHEMIVGNLVSNLLRRAPVPKNRAELTLNTRYYQAAAYSTELMARVLGRSVHAVTGLHFADSEQIIREVPQSVRDLSLLTTHVFWYLELLSHLCPLGSVADSLGFVILFLWVPSLERFQESPHFALAKNAGAWVDETFCKLIARTRKEGTNQTDVVRALLGCVDSLWEERTTQKRKKKAA
jgi:hypothetical protein